MEWLQNIQQQVTTTLDSVDQLAAKSLSENEADAARNARRKKLAADLRNVRLGKSSTTSETEKDDNAINSKPENSPSNASAASRTMPAASKPKADTEHVTAPSASTSHGTTHPRIEQLEKENALLQQEVQALEGEVASFSARVRSTQDTLGDTRSALAALEKQYDKLRESRHGDSELHRKYQEDIEQLNQEKRTLKRRLEAAEKDHMSASQAHDATIASLEAQLAHLKHELSEQSSASRHVPDTSEDLRQLEAKYDSTLLQLQDSMQEAQQMQRT